MCVSVCVFRLGTVRRKRKRRPWQLAAVRRRCIHVHAYAETHLVGLACLVAGMGPRVMGHCRRPHAPGRHLGLQGTEACSVDDTPEEAGKHAHNHERPGLLAAAQPRTSLTACPAAQAALRLACLPAPPPTQTCQRTPIPTPAGAQPSNRTEALSAAQQQWFAAVLPVQAPNRGPRRGHPVAVLARLHERRNAPA